MGRDVRYTLVEVRQQESVLWQPGNCSIFNMIEILNR